jgi:hypothetical protein
MIICHSRRFIFFSNPKTGSESMRALLAPWSEERVLPYRERTAQTPFYPHMSPAEVEWTFDGLGLPFRAYTRFTVVRNPYPRLVSLYRMIGQVDGLWRLRRRLGLGQPDFADWLRGTRPAGSGGGGRAHQRWRRYAAWSAQDWCGDRVDHVLRLEHLDADLPPVLQSLGIAPGRVPHLNSRADEDWAGYYDAGSIALVARRYAYDLDRFGYQAPVFAGAA